MSKVSTLVTTKISWKHLSHSIFELQACAQKQPC